MKIAVMMRAIDQDSGFRKNTEELMETILNIDHINFYILIYRKPKFYGRFKSYPNVKEVLIQNSSKFLWDQISVPFIAIKEKANIIFNPKFSVPLISKIPVAMGLQEPAWWTEPEYYEKWDVKYQRLMLPKFIQKSVHLFPMSNFILEENRKLLGLPLENSTVLYSAANERFKPVKDEEELSKFKKTYNLPEKFILCVTRVDHPGVENSKSFYGGKKPEIAFRSFAKIRKQIPHKLVFAGRNVKNYLYQTEGKNIDLEDVEFTSFIPYKEMHLLYNSADLFINPAPYEGCPSTVIEAMACGMPLILANIGGSVDIGKNAALFAKPYDVDDFAEKILAVLTNETLRKKLENNSLIRSCDFHWEKSAKLFIKTLEGCFNKTEKTPAGIL